MSRGLKMADNNAVPPSTKQLFFVYVVESPSSDDLFDSTTEGGVLCQALRLADIPAWYRLASSLDTFRRSLTTELTKACEHYNSAPIIHISAHGDSNGIQLTDKTFVSWTDLRDLLMPINRRLDGGLVICMSSCSGYSGIRMAMHTDSEIPFFALVGHPESPTWSDAAVAFVTFYHRFFKGAHISDAVSAMQVASGDDRYWVQWGENTQRDWIAHMATESSTSQSGALARAFQNPPLPNGSASQESTD